MVLDPGSVVLEIVGTSDPDADVDETEPSRSRIVLTTPTSVLVAWVGMETSVLVDPARMLSALKLTAIELRAEMVVGSTEVSGAILTIAVGVTSLSTLDVNASRSRIELERTRVGTIELGKTEVGKTEVGNTTSEVDKAEVRAPSSRTEVGKIELASIELSDKLDVSTPRSRIELDKPRLGKTELGKTGSEVGKAEVSDTTSRIEVGKNELASIELTGELDVNTPRSRIELGRVELGRTDVASASFDKTDVRTPPSPSVDVEVGTTLGSAAGSTLSIGVETAAAAVIEEGAALVVNGVVLLSTRQLAAGKNLHVHVLPNHHIILPIILPPYQPILLYLIATLTRCEQHWQQRRPLNQQRTWH